MGPAELSQDAEVSAMAKLRLGTVCTPASAANEMEQSTEPSVSPLRSGGTGTSCTVRDTPTGSGLPVALTVHAPTTQPAFNPALSHVELIMASG